MLLHQLGCLFLLLLESFQAVDVHLVDECVSAEGAFEFDGLAGDVEASDLLLAHGGHLLQLVKGRGVVEHKLHEVFVA